MYIVHIITYPGIRWSRLVWGLFVVIVVLKYMLWCSLTKVAEYQHLTIALDWKLANMEEIKCECKYDLVCIPYQPCQQRKTWWELPANPNMMILCHSLPVQKMTFIQNGKRRQRVEEKLRGKKDITKLTHRPPLNQPHSHLNPLHPLHPENPAKTRIKPRKGMGKKSRNAQEVCILNVLTVIFVYSSPYIYVSFYLFVYLAIHCSEMGQADTFLNETFKINRKRKKKERKIKWKHFGVWLKLFFV